LPEAERMTTVQSRLAEKRPGDGQYAYSLILADHDELPMGPWDVDGEATIFSDIPYYLGVTIRKTEELVREIWEPAFHQDFPWIMARIPYSKPELVEGALRAAIRMSELGASGASGAPAAMLGAERFAVWSDSSRILRRARDALRARDWVAILYGADAPHDVPLVAGSDEEGERQRQALEVLMGSASQDFRPLDSKLRFMGHWSRASPSLVYVLSHSHFWGTDHLDKIIEHLFEPSFPRLIGEYLIDTENLETLSSTHGSSWGQPERPAVFVTTGCDVGHPDNPIHGELFVNTWIAAFIAATESSGPIPLTPAINAEVNIARFIGEGLPIGIAVKAVRECYRDQSPWAMTYWLYPSARLFRVNLFSYVLYGDPTLRLSHGLDADPSLRLE